MKVPAAFRRGYLGHVISLRFLITIVVLFTVDAWLERTVVAQRATLGGFDTASERLGGRPADITTVVGISSLEVEKYFNGKRPIPPNALDSVVAHLLRLAPRVLAVDIFTDDSTYRPPLFSDSLIRANSHRLVWAQFVDTATGELLPVLGGMDKAPGHSGVAAIISDEDRLVRRFRPRYAGVGAAGNADTVQSFPLAAAYAYGGKNNATLARQLSGDTGSIALRAYTRDPPFYLLDDVLSAPANTAKTNLSDRVVVLGFIDGSDQVLTPKGVRTGPEIVADAIETLLDDRGTITAFPHFLDWVIKLALALLIAFIHFRLPPRLAAVSMIVMAIAVVYAAFFIFEYFGYWTNFILIVAGIWIEQLYENVTHDPSTVVVGH